jgi:hypothetical protein
MHKLMLILVVMTIGFFYVGCKGQEGLTESGEDTEMKEEKSEGVISEIEEKVEKMREKQIERDTVKASPEIAAELWTIIQTENYRDHWKMWPGKEALYKGSEPHGALLTTYLNSIGYEAVVKKEHELPPGTIIVKENYMPDKTLGAITVMYNLVGFDPEHGNWFWVKYDSDGTPMKMENEGKTMTLAGKVTSCIGCHTASTSGIKYIMTIPE